MKGGRVRPPPSPHTVADSLCYAAGLGGGPHATRADMETDRLTIEDESFSLNVGLEGAIRPPFRMADVMSKTLGLATDLAFPGHRGSPFQSHTRRFEVATVRRRHRPAGRKNRAPAGWTAPQEHP